MTPTCALCGKSGEGTYVDFPAYSICEECIENDEDVYADNISTGCDD